jgi:hypothetical protein
MKANFINWKIDVKQKDRKPFIACFTQKTLLTGCITLILFCWQSHQALAQRNFFNVPTSEVAEKGHLFFQQNFTYSEKLQSGTTFTYGLGKKFEIGITAREITFSTAPREQFITIDPDNPEDNPDFLINAQKVFEVSNWLNIGLGTRSGVNAAHSREQVNYAGFTYLNSLFKMPGTDFKLTAGAYYANPVYAGPGTNAGLMLGAEVPLWKDKINFQGDMLSGNSTLSRVTLGLGFNLPKEWQIALGGQLPMPKSENPYGITLQISSP